MIHRANRTISEQHVRHCAGVTLVELLVASALMTVLLAGLWGLIDIFTSLATKGGRQTHELRSAVGFFREFERDLRSVPDALLPTSDMPLFYGRARMVQFWIRQAPSLAWIRDAELGHDTQPPVGSESPTAALPSDTVTQQGIQPSWVTRSRPIDLRRIRYELFSSGVLSNEALRAELAGARLVRDESGPTTAAAPLAEDPGRPRFDTTQRSTASDLLPQSPNTAMAPISEITPFPSVEAVRFSYYNGTTWQSHWNSMLHGGLPHAVKVDVWFHGGSHLTPTRLADENENAEWQLDSQNPTATPSRSLDEQINRFDSDPLPVRPADLARLVVLRLKDRSAGSGTR